MALHLVGRFLETMLAHLECMVSTFEKDQLNRTKAECDVQNKWSVKALSAIVMSLH